MALSLPYLQYERRLAIPSQNGADKRRSFATLALIASRGNHAKFAQFIVHSGPPKTKARARYSSYSGGFYTPKSTHSAQKDLELTMLAARTKQLTGNVALLAIFYVPDRRRQDVDNLMKLVLDAGTRAKLWKDDCQVTAQVGLIELDRENPRTVIVWMPYESSLVRGKPQSVCEKCHRVFTKEEWRKPKPPRFCSRECAKDTAGKGLESVPCAFCRKVFPRESAGGRYCSRSCYLQAKSLRSKGRAKARCIECGIDIVRSGHARCRRCYLAKAKAA